MSRLKHLFIPAFVLLLAFPSVSPAWQIFPANYYLTSQQQQILDFQTPPAPGSKEDLADLAAVREWQKKRTAAQCAGANAEGNATFREFFGDLNPFPAPLPDDAFAALGRVGRETDWVVSKLKYRFGRSRPFQRAADLNPCLGRIGGTSYPSGHAALSRMYALVLSNLAPERRKEFMARADEAALYRVIGGVHYPSDIAAGKKTADILYRRFLTSPVFLKDLETMRALIKKPAAVQPRVRDGKRRNL